MSDKLTHKQLIAFSRALRRQGHKLPAVGRCTILRSWGTRTGEVCHTVEGGKHVYRVTRTLPANRWDRQAAQREARQQRAKRLRVSFDVHEGAPSWHQQRAGHTSASVTGGFRTRADAEAYLRQTGGRGYITQRTLKPRG